MTPEAYMRRYHGPLGYEEAETAEERFPCCPLLAAENPRSGGCAGTEAGQTDPDEDDTCCCKGSMADALGLLSGNTLSSLVDFDAFFFLTDALAIGSPLFAPGSDTDNISDPDATLHRFSPCNCDLLDVSGPAYFAVPTVTVTALEDVDQLSLCAIKAVAFQIRPSDCDDCADSNYRRAVRAIRRVIQTEGGTTEPNNDCDDCCCASGIRNELAQRNLSRLATLTVGPLVLQNVTVLGSLGSVLILANEDLSRVYLICANAVEALG